MAQVYTATNLEFLKISNGTNKNCHMCPKEFLSVPELHEHIDKDHELMHPHQAGGLLTPCSRDLDPHEHPSQFISISAILKWIQVQQPKKMTI